MRRRQKLLLLVTVAAGILCLCFRPGHTDEDSSAAAGTAAKDVDCKKKVSIFIPDNPKYAAYMLKIQSNKDLVCLERSEPVYVALLGRHGIDTKYRREAISGLVKIRKTEPLQQLLTAVTEIDKNGITVDPGDESEEEPTELQFGEVLTALSEMLSDFTAEQLAGQRSTLEEIAETSQHDAVRTFGYAGVIEGGGAIEEVWKSATAHGVDDLLRAVRFLRSDNLRALFYGNIMPLLNDAPDANVRRAAIRAVAYVPGHDAEVFEALSALIRDEDLRDDAVVALRQMGRARWPKDQLGALAEQLVEYVRTVPANQRTTEKARAAVTLTEELAALLPGNEAAKVLDALAALSVRVIQLKTLYEEMTYDQSVLVVQAGRPVEIQFDNGDTTPHNLVVTVPGAYEEIGLTADLMATQPGSAERQYLPESDKILHHTNMLDTGQSEPLFFVAPDKPDVYPFLCTFPGHWLKMYGVLVVVDDVKTYLAENDPLPSADQLLGIVTCTHDYDALVADLSPLQSGRSFENGQRQFIRASCQSCHPMRGKGGKIGPELSEISKKYKPHEILRHMMYPSEKIDPLFAKVEIIDDDGKPHLGVIVKETETEIHLMADPLADCEPEVIAKTDDLERYPSKVSPMPEGLLNRVCGDALWDLLSYVIAGADPDNAAFSEK